MKKSKYIVIIILIILVIIFGYLYLSRKDNSNDVIAGKIDSFIGKDINYINEYKDKYDIKFNFSYKYSNSIGKDMVISQSVEEGTLLSKIDSVDIVISLGQVNYNEYNVNELGEVPIMMYHGIKSIGSSDTGYTGGNVDKDGYTRTSEAFRNDLEFYYNNGYRMIRLNDYINGDIDVELGKSPIILTFDDGFDNNIKVLGKDDKGNIMIDPDSAVGILEEFKKKYKDYNVTATFFVNSSLFNQEDYTEDILNWLVDNGYDIGNHTMNHVNFTKISKDNIGYEVGGLYNILDGIIPDKYVNIIALPFGSPYKVEHENYGTIIDNFYNDKEYKSVGALRVGWKANESCFSREFDPLFMKRIRAYDNNGSEFDIEMNFKLLESSRYISDGDKDYVVIHDKDKDNVIGDKEVITY